jgi:hypothetical protein
VHTVLDAAQVSGAPVKSFGECIWAHGLIPLGVSTTRLRVSP